MRTKVKLVLMALVITVAFTTVSCKSNKGTQEPESHEPRPHDEKVISEDTMHHEGHNH